MTVMSDIVERLRHTDLLPVNEAVPLMREAADEIERQAAEIEFWKNGEWVKRDQEAKAEIERLRENWIEAQSRLGKAQAKIEQMCKEADLGCFKIAQLELEIERLKGLLIDGVPKLADKRLAEQDAEIERLRNALTNLVIGVDHGIAVKRITADARAILKSVGQERGSLREKVIQRFDKTIKRLAK